MYMVPYYLLGSTILLPTLYIKNSVNLNWSVIINIETHFNLNRCQCKQRNKVFWYPRQEIGPIIWEGMKKGSKASISFLICALHDDYCI